jgi:hypothetical protein
MTPLEVLVAGRDLLSDPDRWTQRALARDKKGEATDNPWDAKATCFCSLGAVHKVLGSGELELKFEVKQYLSQAAPTHSIVPYNDNHTHAEVLAVWDEAIKAATADARHI